MKIRKLIKSSDAPELRATLRVYCGEEKFFGPGKYQLLEQIMLTGSISQAAKAMNMSYKKAWDMVNALNEQCTKPIVVTATGGNKGGKTTLTEEGIELLKAYDKLQEKFQKFVEKHIDTFLEHK